MAGVVPKIRRISEKKKFYLTTISRPSRRSFFWSFLSDLPTRASYQSFSSIFLPELIVDFLSGLLARELLVRPSCRSFCQSFSSNHFTRSCKSSWKDHLSSFNRSFFSDFLIRLFLRDSCQSFYQSFLSDAQRVTFNLLLTLFDLVVLVSTDFKL